jgi:hypothetical protein
MTTEMSVYLIDEWPAEDMQKLFPDCRLTAFRAADARAARFVVIRVPQNGNDAHATVLREDNPGQRPSKGNVLQLLRTATWVDASG